MEDEGEPSVSGRVGVPIPPITSRFQEPFGTFGPMTTQASGGSAWIAGGTPPGGPRTSGAAGDIPTSSLYPLSEAHKSFTVHPNRGNIPFVAVCSAFSAAEQGLLYPGPSSTGSSMAGATTTGAVDAKGWAASQSAERRGYESMSTRDLNREIARMSDELARKTGARPKRRHLFPEPTD